MERITLRDIVRETKGSYFGPAEMLNAPVADIVRDNREVAAGALFAAFAGARVDGHDFIPAALKAGALACLGTRESAPAPYIRVADVEYALGEIARWYRRQFYATIIGVTGSVGKTTCKEMLAAVLAQKYCVLATEGNYNNSIGLPLTLFRLTAVHQVAVVEMGINHFGEMRRLAEIAQPDYGVFTNAGDAHLENLGDRKGVVRAKTEMTEQMQPGAAVFLNGDDAEFRCYTPPAGIRPILYGTAANSDYVAEEIVERAEGISCRINGVPLFLPAHGRHLVYSLLPAFAVAKELGLSDQQIAAGAARFQPPSGRGNLIQTAKLRIVDSTYNANPTSMRAALDALAAMEGRKVAFLGDMYELGPDSPALHAEIGAYAKDKAELVIAIGALAQAMPSHHWFETPQQAIAALPQLLQGGDAVLVKSSHSLHLDQLVAALEAF